VLAIAELSPEIATQHTAHSQRRWYSRFLDLSCLRWTHESYREAYGRPDPASFSTPYTSMRYMNPHLGSRLILVLPHQPAFCALFDLLQLIFTGCASHFTPTLPTQPEQAFSRSTSSHPGFRSPIPCSHFNTIQTP
jgi:hypothetical protein